MVSFVNEVLSIVSCLFLCPKTFGPLQNELPPFLQDRIYFLLLITCDQVATLVWLWDCFQIPIMRLLCLIFLFYVLIFPAAAGQRWMLLVEMFSSHEVL